MRAGASHILVVSGLHVGIVIGFVYLLLSKILRISNNKILHSITLLVVGAYAMITGSAPPVVRTWIMYAMACLPLMINRKYDITNSQCLAAFIILLIEPNNLFNLSFLLSFGAVAGIVCIMSLRKEYHILTSDTLPRIKCYDGIWKYRVLRYGIERELLGKKLYISKENASKVANFAEKAGRCVMIIKIVINSTWRRIKRFATDILIMTIGAQMFTLPLVIYKFHFISFGGYAASLVAIPIATILIPVTLCYLILNPLFEAIGVCETTDILFGAPMDLLAETMTKTMETIAALPYSGIDHIPFDAMDAVLATMGIILAYIYLKERKRLVGYCVVGVFAIGLGYGGWQRYKCERAEFVCVYNTYGTTAVNYCGNGMNVMCACNDTVSKSFWKMEQFWANNYLPSVSIKKDVNCIRMGEKVIYVLNKDGIEADSAYALVITKECKEKARSVLDRIKTKRVVMDGTCGKWTRENWKKECEERGIRYWDVREKGSVRINRDDE